MKLKFPTMSTEYGIVVTLRLVVLIVLMLDRNLKKPMSPGLMFSFLKLFKENVKLFRVKAELSELGAGTVGLLMLAKIDRVGRSYTTPKIKKDLEIVLELILICAPKALYSISDRALPSCSYQ